jgi:hypothetical protein
MNIVINTTKYAQKKKLRPEQLLEVNAFLTVSLYLYLSSLFDILLLRMLQASIKLNCSSTSWHRPTTSKDYSCCASLPGV